MNRFSSQQISEQVYEIKELLFTEGITVSLCRLSKDTKVSRTTLYWESVMRYLTAGVAKID
jgi:hypothetical protein